MIILDRIAMALATFGMGCLWCTEAIFQNLKGVYSVTSGYIGGMWEPSIDLPFFTTIKRKNTLGEIQKSIGSGRNME